MAVTVPRATGVSAVAPVGARPGGAEVDETARPPARPGSTRWRCCRRPRRRRRRPCRAPAPRPSRWSARAAGSATSRQSRTVTQGESRFIVSMGGGVKILEVYRGNILGLGPAFSRVLASVPEPDCPATRIGSASERERSSSRHHPPSPSDTPGGRFPPDVGVAAGRAHRWPPQRPARWCRPPRSGSWPWSISGSGRCWRSASRSTTPGTPNYRPGAGSGPAVAAVNRRAGRSGGGGGGFAPGVRVAAVARHKTAPVSYSQVLAVVVHAGVILALGRVIAAPLVYARETTASATTVGVVVSGVRRGVAGRPLSWGNRPVHGVVGDRAGDWPGRAVRTARPVLRRLAGVVCTWGWP